MAVAACGRAWNPPRCLGRAPARISTRGTQTMHGCSSGSYNVTGSLWPLGPRVLLGRFALVFLGAVCACGGQSADGALEDAASEEALDASSFDASTNHDDGAAPDEGDGDGEGPGAGEGDGGPSGERDGGPSGEGDGGQSGDGDGGQSGDGDGEPLVCAAGLADCDGDAVNGCEESLAGNAKHCGACGRDCTAIGATCSADGCSAATLFTSLPFGTDNRRARTWAFGQGAAYQMGNTNYVVRRYPLDGAASSTVWNGGTGNTGGTEALLVTASHVIWAQRGSPPTVLAKPHGAAAEDLPSVLFTPAYQPTFMLLAGGTYYWASGDYQSGDAAGYIYSRPDNAAGGAGTQIVSVNQGNHGSFVALAATSDALYWVTSQAGTGTAYELRTTPLAGGTPTVVPGGAINATSTAQQTTLRASGKTLYFNRNVGDSFLNGIYRYAPGDAAPTQLVSAENVLNFVVDEDAFYYVQANQAGIWRAARTGSAGVKISPQQGTEIVGQDASFLYVSLSSSGASTLYKVRK